MEVKTIRQLPPNTELVEVVDGVIICKDATPDLRELGSSGATNYHNMWRGEYKSELMGIEGRRTYHKMRRSDGQVHGLLRLVKTPILAARWYVAPPTQGGDLLDSKPLRRKDKQMAQFVHNCLFHYGLTKFPQFLFEALGHLDFGFYAFEKVWEIRTIRGQKRAVIKDFAPRHPLDAACFEYDAHGRPTALQSYGDGEEVLIPYDKLIVFTHEQEGNDLEGVSMLRPAYKHWYYKEQMYKVDAIQKERHGIGIPVIKLPPSYGPNDKAYAQELGRNLRTNESAHVVLPPLWDIMMLKLEGQLVKPLDTIEHHDRMMARAVLGQFLNIDAAQSITDFMDLFLKSTRFIADQMRDEINQRVIPELIQFNFRNVQPEEYPELRVRRLGDTVDWRTISFALRNLVGAGIIKPDDRLEDWIREEMDLPVADEATSRLVLDLETPQGLEEMEAALEQVEKDEQELDGQAGLPRQSQAGNRKRTPGNNGQVGDDRSGS